MKDTQQKSVWEGQGWKLENGFRVFSGNASCYMCFTSQLHTQAEHDAEVQRVEANMPADDWQQQERDEHNRERMI